MVKTMLYSDNNDVNSHLRRHYPNASAVMFVNANGMNVML